MIKQVLSTLTMIFICSTSPIIEAQTFFGSFGQNSPSRASSPQNKFKPTIPSPQTYKSAVEATYQQYQQDVANQVKKQMMQPSSLSAKPPATLSSGSTSPSPGGPTISQPVYAPPPSVTTSPSTPTVAPPPETYTTTTESQPEKTSQKPVYSGFQGGSNSQSKPASNTGSGSNWNINY